MVNKIKSLVNKYQYKNKYLGRYIKMFKKWRGSVKNGHPYWGRILEKDRDVWNKAVHSVGGGPKILLATSIGQYFSGTTLESTLAVALTLRGAEIHVLLCDSFLPACMACDYTWYPHEEQFAKYGPKTDVCQHCYQPAQSMFDTLGIVQHRYSDLLTKEELHEIEKLVAETPVEAIPDYIYNNCSVGEHALAGALRFYGRCDLSEEPHAAKILQRYFHSALLVTCATGNLFRNIKFHSSVFHHGIYVPQGLIGEVARRYNVPVVNWNPAYRKQCFIFSHNDSYHHTLMSEPVEKWENITWDKNVEAKLLDYLKSRWQGSQDWIWFHDRPNFDLTEIINEIGIDFSKPTIGLLTNVLWDAQLHYPENIFPNMLEWVLQTISYFADRPELNLLIRTHPAEIHGAFPARQSVVDEIKKAFPELPVNVYVIPPESHVSTYVAMAQCDSVLIYGTKTGVELTSVGIPVIVAGEAWIRNKGVTYDATSIREYFELLDLLPLNERMSEDKISRARKYAFHFFFRRMIPLEFLEPTKNNPPYRVNLSGLDDLMPGGSLGLDIICNGILFGTDFIYPAETISLDH